jgi:hypothetical protein
MLLPFGVLLSYSVLPCQDKHCQILHEQQQRISMRSNVRCSKMSTRSAREYAMFAPPQLLRNWREQRPSNQGDLDWSVVGEVGRVYYTRGGCTVLPDCCWVAFYMEHSVHLQAYLTNLSDNNRVFNLLRDSVRNKHWIILTYNYM